MRQDTRFLAMLMIGEPGRRYANKRVAVMTGDGKSHSVAGRNEYGSRQHGECDAFYLWPGIIGLLADSR